jgi:hypothetical protein
MREYFFENLKYIWDFIFTPAKEYHLSRIYNYGKLYKIKIFIIFIGYLL